MAKTSLSRNLNLPRLNRAESAAYRRYREPLSPAFHRKADELAAAAVADLQGGPPQGSPQREAYVRRVVERQLAKLRTWQATSKVAA
jgi:hypothetical protein